MGCYAAGNILLDARIYGTKPEKRFVKPISGGAVPASPGPCITRLLYIVRCFWWVCSGKGEYVGGCAGDCLVLSDLFFGLLGS